MKRIWMMATLASLCWQVPALAQTPFADPVIARIEAEGFVLSEVRRTWLGRILIVARDDAMLREIVMNRTTGEVLRDRLFPLPADAPALAPSSDETDTPLPTTSPDTPPDRPPKPDDDRKDGPGGDAPKPPMDPPPRP